jgi:hypothetical protein
MELDNPEPILPLKSPSMPDIADVAWLFAWFSDDVSPEISPSIIAVIFPASTIRIAPLIVI